LINGKIDNKEKVFMEFLHHSIFAFLIRIPNLEIQRLPDAISITRRLPPPEFPVSLCPVFKPAMFTKG